MESMNDKLSIKNLLFCKAIPNYVVPVPTGGHRLFCCTDCGDKFVLESSYEFHINRKSVHISYHCRYCCQVKVFHNRCNLLAHIRSHAFKTATINVTDLKIQPLPLKFFNMKALKTVNTNETAPKSSVQKPQAEIIQNQKTIKSICFECKKDITCTGTMYKDRTAHYMQYTNEVHTCPVCMFTLPTSCGLKAHLRIHLKCPPFYCPECGIHLPNRSIVYPFNHDCEGFKMMRATARVKCAVPECHLLHPNEYKDHLKGNHLKKVYKCPFCYVACFSEPIMSRHLKNHNESGTEGKALIFYQCEICPGRLVLQNQIDNHLKGHIYDNKYPCWSCGRICKDVSALIEHHVEKHGLSNDLNESSLRHSQITKPKRVYRVIKRCDQCKRSFTYKCKFEQIRMLPSECPYKCSANLETSAMTPPVETTEAHITCHICKSRISEKWEVIKQHYADHHKTYRCLDAQVLITKLDIKKFAPKKRKRHSKHADGFTVIKKIRSKKVKGRKTVNNVATSNIQTVTNVATSNIQIPKVSISNNDGKFLCIKCNHESENRQQLETHMISHRDPCMAYQCMDCGQSFVVKPSFSTHLLLEHGISDVEDYIKRKQCYNESALMKYQYGSTISIEPLCENQCRICREQFNDPGDLEKHFRVHGMAFLLKNNSNKNTSP